MQFYFVDRIFEIVPQKSIIGLKNVTRNEGFFYWLPNGQRVLSPAVVTEALCQLGGWLKIVNSNFEKRPVLLADELTEYHGMVSAGDQIELKVAILEMNDDVVVTKGTACVNGKPVLTGHQCRGYLLPLKDFDDPERVRKQFDNLYKPNFSLPKISPEGKTLPAIAGKSTFESLRYIDGVLEHIPGKKIRCFKNVAACEPYFVAHFPRKPCVPGVILLTFLGESCQYLVRDSLDAPVREKALIPTFIRNVRFRKFVEPGDHCILECTLLEGDLSKHQQDIVIKSTIFANDQRVMQAEMGFQTMFAYRDIKGMPQWPKNDAS